MTAREMPAARGEERDTERSTEGSTREAYEADMCDHTSPVSQEHIDLGFRFRCARCGAIGPERPNPMDAWDALRNS